MQDYIGCLSVEEMRDYLANLMVALRHMHKHGLLHRDVKPANFLYHRASHRYVTTHSATIVILDVYDNYFHTIPTWT